MSKIRRNILTPFDSYIIQDEKQVNVSSIRVYKNPKIKKLEISFYNGTSKLLEFSTAKLAMNLVRNYHPNSDAIVFSQNSKKTVAVLYLKQNKSIEFYKSYLHVMNF